MKLFQGHGANRKILYKFPSWCSELKDLASLLQRLGFNPWPRNFRMPQVGPKKNQPKKKKNFISKSLHFNVFKMQEEKKRKILYEKTCILGRIMTVHGT